MSSKNWIVVGKFGRPHGIKGQIKVVSFTEPFENILNYQPWHLNDQQQPGALIELAEIQQNHSGLTVLVKGYQDRNQAACLTNQEIMVKRELLPELDENEHYWHDLVNLEVINRSNEKLGHVKEIMPTGANDVLVVTGDKRYLIPYVPKRYILKVDLANKCIRVDWDVDG